MSTSSCLAICASLENLEKRKPMPNINLKIWNLILYYLEKNVFSTVVPVIPALTAKRCKNSLNSHPHHSHQESTQHKLGRANTFSVCIYHCSIIFRYLSPGALLNTTYNIGTHPNMSGARTKVSVWWHRKKVGLDFLDRNEGILQWPKIRHKWIIWLQLMCQSLHNGWWRCKNRKYVSVVKLADQSILVISKKTEVKNKNLSQKSKLKVRKNVIDNVLLHLDQMFAQLPKKEKQKMIRGLIRGREVDTISKCTELLDRFIKSTNLFSAFTKIERRRLLADVE